MRERGSSSIEFAVGVLVLVVPAALLVLSFGPALERRVLARSLAGEVARVVAESGGAVPAGAAMRFDRLVESSGVVPSEVHVGLCEQPPQPLGGITGCSFDGRASVVVTVEIQVPPLLPGGPSVVSYTHREPLDPYRSLP